MTTEYVLENIKLMVVNQAARLPAGIPVLPFLDLKAVLWITVDGNEPDNVAIAAPTDEVISAAQRNTLAAGWTCRRVADVIGAEPTGTEMYIITNREGHNGASALLFPDTAFAELPEGDWYILPSSVHEVLAVPAKSADAAGLAGIVRGNNRKSGLLGPGEWLSDSVYLWDGESLTVAED